MGSYILIFGIPLSVIFFFYFFIQNKNTKKALEIWDETVKSGVTEPASLHPLIDPNKCLGCAVCVHACPEGKILGLIERKAQLISPTSCIGHGACREACPTDAIQLVFGSTTRGVEIPLLNSDFQTNVEGIYIAGELGGMGLIKNAISQGQSAAKAIAKNLPKSSQADYDLIIVGAGPAGLSAALAAKERGLRFITLEQDTVGGTIAHYPRGKVVMSQPAELPLVGKFQFREVSKEQLVEFWDSILQKVDLHIKTGQCVSDIAKAGDCFTVKTNHADFKTKTVLLTMGRRGTPRKLDVPGEELSKVVYRLTDPEQYAGQHVLIVGGGDSALEAALAIAEQPNTHTTISYRSAAFSRAKPKNMAKMAEAEKSGKIRVLMQSDVLNITKSNVAIKTDTAAKEIPNDAIIVCAGGVLPTPFLKRIGIHVEEKFGTA